MARSQIAYSRKCFTVGSSRRFAVINVSVINVAEQIMSFIFVAMRLCGGFVVEDF